MGRKRKLAVFGVKTVPYTGGIENVVENTVPFLTDFDVIVYVRKKYFSNEKLPNVRLVCLSHLNGKTFEAFSHTINSIFHAIFIEKADIFFFHAVVLGLFTPFPRLFGKKVILQSHGLDWKREKWGKLTKYLIRFSTLLAAHIPNKTICVGKEDQLFFKKQYNKEFKLVSNGVRISRFVVSNKILNLLKLQKDEYFLFMARLVPEKGAHILISAFKEFIKKENSNRIKLVIAGDTNYRDNYYYSLLAEKSDKILFPGFVKGDDKYNLISNAKCFIQPSSIEGMSTGILEAMALGTIPLVSDIPENIDLIDKFGLTFRLNDVSELKIKFNEVLDNKTQINKVEMTTFVHKKYSWENTINNLQNILTSFI